MDNFKFSIIILFLFSAFSCKKLNEDHLFVNQSLVSPSKDSYTWDIEIHSEKANVQFYILKARLEKEEENIIQVDEFSLIDKQVINESLSENEESHPKYKSYLGKFKLELEVNNLPKKSSLKINNKKYLLDILDKDFGSSSRITKKWKTKTLVLNTLLNAHINESELIEDFIIVGFIPCNDVNNKMFEDIYSSPKFLQDGYVLAPPGSDYLNLYNDFFKDL